MPGRILGDFSPLKESRDFRLLFSGQLVGTLGSQLTVVAIPYQVYLQTHSSLQVGAISMAQLGPLIVGLDPIPAHMLKSITFDQGSEWAAWRTVAATYNLDVWFCDPHSPWQHGQVENLNRQWRWWFPRGMNLIDVEQSKVDHASSIINGQRRRSFNYESPAALCAAAAVQ